jgi:hypothetical protein
MLLKTIILLALCPCGPGCDCGPGCACGPVQFVRDDTALKTDPAAPPQWVLDRLKEEQDRQRGELVALKADVAALKAQAGSTAAGIAEIKQLLTQRPADASLGQMAAVAPKAAARREYYLQQNGDWHWFVDHPTRAGWVVPRDCAWSDAAPGVAAAGPFGQGGITPATSAPCAGGCSTSSPGRPAAGVTITHALGAGQAGCTSGGCAGGACGVPQRRGLFGWR